MKHIISLHEAILKNVSRVIIGKEKVIDLLTVTLLCGGHALIEDVPGTGKTKLVKALAASLDCTFKRIQFTPDLLPSDITGINFFNMKTNEFEFIPGPAFSNIVLADEINRATPKTQAGLLECMEEKQVTIDGTTRQLDEPFMVVATQNKIESSGVFPLPEAQLDRFFMKLSMDYPTLDESVAILERFSKSDPLTSLSPVITRADIAEAKAEVCEVFMHRDIMRYIIAICEATKHHDNVVLGVSPRASLALMRASQGYAAINGRDFVIPDDVKAVSASVLAHRLILKNSARFKSNFANEIIGEVLESVTAPTEDINAWRY
ncbi:MAG TPA: MoxR family ATPase [Bacillota bacterium]|nr:MoxR family ATPase [Bacillota bacterium]